MLSLIHTWTGQTRRQAGRLMRGFWRWAFTHKTGVVHFQFSLHHQWVGIHECRNPPNLKRNGLGFEKYTRMPINSLYNLFTNIEPYTCMQDTHIHKSRSSLNSRFRVQHVTLPNKCLSLETAPPSLPHMEVQTVHDQYQCGQTFTREAQVHQLSTIHPENQMHNLTCHTHAQMPLLPISLCDYDWDFRLTTCLQLP